MRARLHLKLLHQLFVAIWPLAACSPPLPTYVVTIPEKRPLPGTEYIVPGPLPQAGPFKTPFDALLHACPRLLSLPDAQPTLQSEVMRHGSFYVERSWDASTEYCAWIYATPKGEYEISWIATDEIQNKGEVKKCSLPRRVFDRRYADDPLYLDRNIIYVLAIHNHPVPNILTQGDIGYIIDVDRYITESLHNNGQADLGIVAFFASTNRDDAVCGGFFQYTLSTNEIRKWTPSKDGRWHSATVATVRTKQVAGKLKVEVDMIK